MPFDTELITAAERVRDAALEAEIAKTMAQFAASSGYAPSRGETIWEALEATEEQLYSDLEGKYEYIVDRFRLFAKGEVWAYDEMIESFDRARIALQSGIWSNMGLVEDGISDWGGKAADSFRQTFVFPFRDAVLNQQNLLSEVMAGLEEHRKIVEAAQDDIMKIAEQTEVALKELDPRATGGSSDFSLGDGLKIIGLITGIAGIPLTGPGVALVLTLINNARSVTETTKGFIDSAREESAANDTPVIGGWNYMAVLGSMNDAIDKLTEEIDLKEQELASKLKSSRTSLEDFLYTSDVTKPVNTTGQEVDSEVLLRYFIKPLRPWLADNDSFDKEDFAPKP